MERVKMSQHWGNGGYSHYFFATKRSDGFCLTLNLSGLNTFLHFAKFRMETLISILQGLHKGWWMVLLDLKHAYLHVLIHPSHWSYLRFAPRNLPGSSMFISSACVYTAELLS